MGQESSLKKRTVMGMIWASVQRCGTMAISFISNIILARMLTPTDYGYIGMLMIFITVSNTFIDGGFGSALIQKTNPTQKDYSTVFYWNLFFSIFLYGILYLCAPFIAAFFKMPLLSSILRLLGVVLIINGCNIVQFNMLRKRMEFRTIAWIYIASAIVSVCAAIILAFKGFGVWSLVWQQIINCAALLILVEIVRPWRPDWTFSIGSFKTLGGFGSFILLSNLVNSFANNLTGLIVGKFFSANTLGYLTQARKVEEVASTSIANTVEQVSYPLLVEVKNDYGRMAQILCTFNSALLAVVAPLMFVIAIAAQPIIVFLFTDKWLESVPILQILCFQGIFICLQGASYNVVAAIGKSRILLNWTLVKRISGMILWIIGLILFGFQGLLYAMILSSFMIWVCNGYLVQRFIGYRLSRQFLDLLPIALAAGIPFGMAWGIMKSGMIELSPILLALLYLVIYLAVLLFIPQRNVMFIKQNLKNLLQRR